MPYVSPFPYSHHVIFSVCPFRPVQFHEKPACMTPSRVQPLDDLRPSLLCSRYLMFGEHTVPPLLRRWLGSKYTRSLQTFFSPATASLVSKNCIAPAVVLGMDVVVERVGLVGESESAVCLPYLFHTTTSLHILMRIPIRTLEHTMPTGERYGNDKISALLLVLKLLNGKYGEDSIIALGHRSVHLHPAPKPTPPTFSNGGTAPVVLAPINAPCF